MVRYKYRTENLKISSKATNENLWKTIRKPEELLLKNAF